MGTATDSVHRLTISLDEWLAKSQASARLKFIDVCLEAAEGIVDKTPVDTGFARASWSVSINEEPLAKPDVKRPEKWASLPPGAAKAEAVATITVPLLGTQLGDRVFLYNPVVYIIPLEHGHSQQAPLGMVGLTVTELQVKYGGT